MAYWLMVTRLLGERPHLGRTSSKINETSIHPVRPDEDEALALRRPEVLVEPPNMRPTAIAFGVLSILLAQARALRDDPPGMSCRRDAI